MPDHRLALFADADVGERFLAHVAREYPGDIGLLVVQPGSGVERWARANGFQVHVDDGRPAEESLRQALSACTVGLLCWWPRLIPADLLALPRRGFVNTHPSLLPHNRGKHPNFWAIVEQRPFGVSLHEVTPGIDAGAVVAQAGLPVGWEDNGQTLHERSRQAMFDLLVEFYPVLRAGSWSSSRQALDQGSFHLGRELEEASTIVLDRQYSGRELLNLLRARTYRGHPACRFVDGGLQYEARVEIKKVESP
jgi:methionyl-tRNA formyltransferase